LATDAGHNLRGAGKLAAIQKHSAGAFDYAGDSPVDLPIFQACRQAYVVGAGRALQDQVAALTPARPPVVMNETKGGAAALYRALRPKHWIKNVLLFVPLLFAHDLGDFQKLRAVAWAFAAMNLCASSVYVLNDLLDLESDRSHPRKRHRPFASGALSIPAGLVLCMALMLSAMALAWSCVGWKFAAALAGYLVATMAYSFVFKRKLLLDVIVLAGLYTARILAGAVAANVAVSSWLAAFSMFVFLSLAFVKRYSELTVVKKAEQTQTKGRSYMVDDQEIILSVGTASGYMAVLVFCLYISSDAVRSLYRHPQMLWCICPLLIYWITRVWFFARRTHLEDDPVLFAINDRVSWLCGLAALGVMLAAGPIR
jgi:4-hydroxybenzoate polyprenyltransferase